MSTWKRLSTWVRGATVHPDARHRLNGPLRDEEFITGNRADSLTNSFLGFGTARDKMAYGSFVQGARLTDIELHALYYSDAVSAKIVNLRHSEMLRAGYKLTAKDPGKATALQKRGADLFLDDRVLRGAQWGALYGGSLLVFGAIDGSSDLTKPLNVKGTVDVKFVNAIDRRFITVQRWQDNPFAPRYGEPEVYTVSAPGGGLFSVHASRVIRFDGVPETDPVTRRELGGWTYSVLQRPYDTLRKFATAYESIAHLLTDASQGVFKIDGLIDLIAQDKDELMTRLAFLDMTRSAGRAIMVDAETEDFTRVATPFAGVGDVVDRIIERLSADTGYPVALLMGRAASGLNATGDSDFRSWYGQIASDQKNELKPKLLEAYKILAGNELPEDLDIEFCPLWEPTRADEAATEKTEAETANIYVGMGALLPQQVAIAKWGDGDGKIEIDQASLEESLEQEIDLMLNPPEPPAPGVVDPNAPPPDPNAPPPNAPKVPADVPPSE